jgi:hypothetical protein
VGPAHKKLSWELRGIQSNCIAYVNRHVLPESIDNAYDVLNAVFRSIAGFYYGSEPQIHTKMC